MRDRYRYSSRVSRPRLGAHRLVVVQVDERDAMVPQHVAQAAGLHQVLDVAPVPRPLGDDHLGGSLALAQLDGGSDDVGVRVDHPIAVILDQVRLQDHALAGQRHLGAKGLVLALQHTGQVALVVVLAGNVDRRLTRRLPQVADGLDGDAAESGQDSPPHGRRTAGSAVSRTTAAPAVVLSRRKGLPRSVASASTVNACRGGAEHSQLTPGRSWQARSIRSFRPGNNSPTPGRSRSASRASLIQQRCSRSSLAPARRCR